MNEFVKIPNLFEFDAKYKQILGYTSTFEVMKNLIWQGTEKVDGTNIRVHWDGHRIELGGRTDAAAIPAQMVNYLNNMFLSQEMEYIFEQMFEDKDVILFGEGFGKGIQKNGELYGEPRFILFDVQIEGYYLTRDNVQDIAEKLALDTVPILFEGTLDKAVKFVGEHHMSTIDSRHEMEGLVLEPKGIRLYDNKFKPIKCKCKYRDLVKAGLATK